LFVSLIGRNGVTESTDPNIKHARFPFRSDESDFVGCRPTRDGHYDQGIPDPQC
jgi:hypothetical protein